MKKIWTILGLLLVTASAFGTTRYIAQTAGTFSGGSACNGQTAITPATFNSTTLSPGDTAYICGTLTAAAGASNFLTIGQSGTSGNPISIIFDTGAVITATYWSGPVIYFPSLSYITIDGGTNGVIQATANGSSPANQQDGAIAISNGAPGSTPTTVTTNVTVQNLTISNLYVDSSLTDNGGQNTYSIKLGSVNNVVIQNNVIHDVKWAIAYDTFVGLTNSGITITGNNIYNIDHGLFIAATGSTSAVTVSNLYFYSNTLGSRVNWDNTALNTHHDYVHIFTSNSGTLYSNFNFYNNYGSGDVGANANGGLQVESQYSNTVQSFHAFNNVFANTSTNHCWADGTISQYFSGPSSLVANNTIVSSTTSCSDIGVSFNSSSTGLTSVNNIVNAATAFYGTSGVTITQLDYDNYYGFTSLYNNGTQYTTLSSWQTATGFDTHSSIASPSLSGSYHPTTGSPVIGAGTNLYATCNGQPIPGLGALCSDAAGVARPSAGAWDAGAYQYAGGPPNWARPSHTLLLVQ